MPTRLECANAIRFLSMDAVQQANSGHPGAPMGMADIAEVLWRDFLKHNPTNPHWPDRDRFVLSNGHGSMLLYSLLHLTGYDLGIDDLRSFRQLHSKTPGHPEYGLTPGVETTSGPLGQGVTCAVGMALAERMLACQFNRSGHEIVDHFTYVFLGDGCMMEGISHEACSLAGTLGLGKLIAIYDDNGISIDGDVKGWFTEDRALRFKAYGWHVIPNVDGHDPDAVHQAIALAKSTADRPSLICCQTVIGYGAPNLAGTAKTHGAPLGPQEIQGSRNSLNWQHPPFHIPEDILREWDAREQGASAEAEWNERFQTYEQKFPKLASEFRRRMDGLLPDNFQDIATAFLRTTIDEERDLATRRASNKCLEGLGSHVPELVGGSADLAGSNLTIWTGSKVVTRDDFGGNYINYGVREFAMQAIMNGLALHGGFLPYGGTFLVFSDYMRSALRLSAIMGLRTITVLTHDSIGVGEDGPTHQPIEHLASLRLIPGLHVWRPCDSVETAHAWISALKRQGPSVMALSRQNLPFLERDETQLADVSRGGYILRDTEGTPEAILLATGSEVALAVAAAEELARLGRKVRVVSMPCVEVFETQDQRWRDEVLPSAVTARIAIEAGVTAGWYKYVGSQGCVIGLDRFGLSAPGETLFEYLGCTVDKIIEAVEGCLTNSQ